jgi:hypothetical protein
MKKEADMAIHDSQGILNGQRQPKPRHDYAVPRYRVTLVRESRATAPSSPLLTSVAAAAILRPCFAGLDREQFLVCGLEFFHEKGSEIGHALTIPYLNPHWLLHVRCLANQTIAHFQPVGNKLVSHTSATGRKLPE